MPVIIVYIHYSTLLQNKPLTLPVRILRCVFHSLHISEWCFLEGKNRKSNPQEITW